MLSYGASDRSRVLVQPNFQAKIKNEVSKKKNSESAIHLAPEKKLHVEPSCY